MLGKKPNIKVGGDFQTAPADKYTVQITDVNFKLVFNNFKNVEEEKLVFKFVILDDKTFTDSEGKEISTRGITFTDKFSQSLSPKSNLIKLAKAVYGRELTTEELDPHSAKFFDPEKIVGKQVTVMLTEDPNKDGTATFNNVASYLKVVKQLTPVANTAGQSVVESASTPVDENVELPDTSPELDKLLAGIQEDETEEEESVEALEARLKSMKAKKKAEK